MAIKNGVTDKRIKFYKQLPRPAEFIDKFPLEESGKKLVQRSRDEITAIIRGEDRRKLLITGPCSIHDVDQGMEITCKIAQLAKEVKEQFLVIGRLYFEKPRTVDGWKGLVYDPYINNSWDIEAGLELSRKVLLSAINECRLPAATEFLNPFTPQYYSDLISWTAVGARTSETQLYREMMSGLSMPVGYKNNTRGDVDAAVNSLIALKNENCFIGIDINGNASIVSTTGNDTGHLILRGGSITNYDSESVSVVIKSLAENGISNGVVIDCSHGNSSGNFKNQVHVFEDVIDQICSGNESIVGLMTETNLREGKQSLKSDLTGFDKSKLEFGVSITDACIDFETTRELVLRSAEKLSKRSV